MKRKRILLFCALRLTGGRRECANRASAAEISSTTDCAGRCAKCATVTGSAAARRANRGVRDGTMRRERCRHRAGLPRKALWVATQCPDKISARPAGDTKTASSRCAVPEPGFEYEVSSIKQRKNDGDYSSRLGPTSDGYRATNVVMINIVMNAYSTGLQI